MAVPQKLRERLQEKRVIPFVGAGVPMAVHKRGVNAPLFPSWKELLLEAATCLEKSSREISRDHIKYLDVLDAKNQIRAKVKGFRSEPTTQKNKKKKRR